MRRKANIIAAYGLSNRDGVRSLTGYKPGLIRRFLDWCNDNPPPRWIITWAAAMVAVCAVASLLSLALK